MAIAVRVKSGDKIKLKQIDPNDTGGLAKDEALARAQELGKELEDLQELLFAAGANGLLIVLQGRDTAGKDGTIKMLLRYTNVQSCDVAAFKVPTPLEQSHDFLWRVHPHAPAKGAVSIFNRSHYEDVLVVRVHDLAPKQVWSRRYNHINAWERLLSDSGTIILKFMLHIDKDEQEQRLLDREKDPEKAWKLAVRDWKERDFWDEYTEAYEDALRECSQETAPWFVVPANKKWGRDVAILEALVDALRPYRSKWLSKLDEMSAKAKAELEAYRNPPADR